MRKVIALAIFGNHPTYGTRQYYWDCLPGCLRSYRNYYPDFEFRVYHDSIINEPRSALLRRYAAEGLINLIDAGEENNAVCRSMLWRIKPIWDEDVDVLLCRDMDGAACRRERRAVDQWLESGMAVHTINDNPSHTEPLMGGMIGFRCPEVRRLLNVPSWEEFVSHSETLHHPTGGHDQILLRTFLWPRVMGRICAHRFAGMSFDESLGRCYMTIDDKWPEGVSPKLRDRADELVPFIGCSGINVPVAKEVYDSLGDPMIARRIQACEVNA